MYFSIVADYFITTGYNFASIHLFENIVSFLFIYDDYLLKTEFFFHSFVSFLMKIQVFFLFKLIKAQLIEIINARC